MKAKEFIKKTIKDLTTTFDNIKCSYRYDVFSDTHLIEVLPGDFFKNSNDLSLYRADIFDEFDEVYPNQSIVFISDNSLTKLGKPEYSLEGKRYVKVKPFDISWFKKLSNLVHPEVEQVFSASDNNYALAA